MAVRDILQEALRREQEQLDRTGRVARTEEERKAFALPGKFTGASIFPGAFDLLQPDTFATRFGRAQSGGRPPEFDPRVLDAFAALNSRMLRRQIMDRFLRNLLGGGIEGFLSGAGSGLPSRADLLNPRLQDIEQERKLASSAIANKFAGLGRSVTSTPATQATGEIDTQATRERQRATGEVDRLLAELGLAGREQNIRLLQVLMSLLGGTL